MIWLIARRMLRDRWVALVSYCIGSVLMTFLYFATYPAVKDQAQSLMSMAQSLPKGFVEAFQLQNFNPSFDSFFASKHLSLVWPLLVIFFAASLAGRALSGGIETGSIGLEISQPVSRLKVFAAKYLAGTIMLTIFIVVTILATPIYAGPFDVTTNVANYWRLSGLAWLFTMAVFSLAMMVSAFTSERSRMYAPVAGVLIAMYVAWLVGAIKDSYAWLKNVSYFTFFDASKVLNTGSITGKSIAVFSISVVLFTMLGAWWWNRRDISV